MNKEKVAVEMGSVEGLMKAGLISQQKASTFFDVVQCFTTFMPYIRYMGYQAASFCRVYPYSCNNLWAEDLNREIQDGSFCMINWFEQDNTVEVVTAGLDEYTKLLQATITPWYTFMMDYYAFAQPEKGASFMGVPSEQENQCNLPMMSVHSRLECMIQTMKEKLQSGPLPELKLTSNQTLVLVKRAEQFNRQMQTLEETMIVTAQNLAEPVQIPDWLQPIIDNMKVGIRQPLNENWPGSSLGARWYMNSAQEGHFGPISAHHRFPWDQVQPSSAQFTAMKLTDIDPLAVCNDGSPALMYTRKLEPLTKKWHFHIDGGFFCYDQPSCVMRALTSATLVSTKGWETVKNMSGVFDPHMGGFPDYTHAAIGYCSSDAWFGQINVENFTMVAGTKLPNGKEGTYFRGYTILQAVLKQFLLWGLGSTPGHELFVSGCSAGSIAATAQADSWASRLAIIAAENGIKYHKPYIWTLLDGAPIVSPVTDTMNSLPIYTMAMSLVDLLYGPSTGASPDGFLNKKCAAANPGNESTCVWTGSVMPYIETPNAILGMFWDNFITGQLENFFIPFSKDFYKFGLMVVKDLREQEAKVTKKQNFWFSNCGDHCISDNPHFWRLRPVTSKNPEYAKTSAKDVTLWTRDGKLGHIVDDSCDHYNCGCIGQGHGNTAMALQALTLGQMYTMFNVTVPTYSIQMATALAAGQTNNFGQFAISP